MSYVTGNLFYGFELSKKYIKKLMLDIPKQFLPSGGVCKPHTSSNSNEIYKMLETLLGDGLSVEVCSHGTQDGILFGISTSNFFAHAGESQKIDTTTPSKKELNDLRKAADRLGIKIKDTDISWYLGAFWD